MIFILIEISLYYILYTIRDVNGAGMVQVVAVTSRPIAPSYPTC